MFALLVVAVLTVNGMSAASRQADHNDIGLVRGTAVYANHAELGRTPCARCYFVLRSEEARIVAIGFWTDNAGKFELHLSRGKWRLLPVDSCVDCGSDVYDLVADHQKRTFQVVSPNETVQFDIELKFKRAIKQ